MAQEVEIKVGSAFNTTGVNVQGTNVEVPQPQAQVELQVQQNPKPEVRQQPEPTQPQQPSAAQEPQITVTPGLNTVTVEVNGQEVDKPSPNTPKTEALEIEPPEVESKPENQNTAAVAEASKAATQNAINSAEEGWNGSGASALGQSQNNNGDVNYGGGHVSAAYAAKSEDGKLRGVAAATIGFGSMSGEGTEGESVFSGEVAGEVQYKVSEQVSVLAGAGVFASNVKTGSELKNGVEAYAGVQGTSESGKTRARVIGGLLAGQTAAGESARSGIFGAGIDRDISENGSIGASLQGTFGGNVQGTQAAAITYTHHTHEESIPELPDVPATHVKQISSAKISLKGDQLFGFDKDKFTPEGATQLNNLASVLTNPAFGDNGKSFVEQIQAQGGKLNLSAFTDAFGSTEYNQNLSNRRAEAVANYLESRGVPRSIMTAQGFGETQAHNAVQIEALKNQRGTAEYTEMQDLVALDRRVDVAVVGAILKPSTNPEYIAQMKGAGFNVEKTERTIVIQDNDKGAAPMVTVSDSTPAASRQEKPVTSAPKPEMQVAEVVRQDPFAPSMG